MTTSASFSEKSMCEAGGKGVFLPLFSSEHEWPTSLRVVLYLAGMLWCFVGVSIGSDLFVSGIEKIVSTKKRIKTEIHGQQKTITIRVWNDTVANLTLMALGSSAPEILLAIIEILSRRFHSGELGPSTIVGSAAFNLLLIIALCIVSIPSGQSKDIKDIAVFIVTTAFSVFAYFWIIIIVQIVSPDVIELWEAVITLAMFPVFVFVAYLADRGAFSSPAKRQAVMRAHMVGAGNLTQSELKELCAEVRRVHGQNLSDEHVYRIIHAENPPRESRAKYKSMGSMRWLKTSSTSELENSRALNHSSANPDSEIGFTALRYAVMESAGTTSLTLFRKGSLHFPIEVTFSTEDGTAQQGKDYKALTSEKIVVPPYVSEFKIPIEIYDDTVWEEDEFFHVRIDSVEPVQKSEQGADSGRGITSYPDTLSLLKKKSSSSLISPRTPRTDRLDFDRPIELQNIEISERSRKRIDEMEEDADRRITNRVYKPNIVSLKRAYTSSENRSIGTVGISKDSSLARVIIIDDDAPGVLKFEKESLQIQFARKEEEYLTLRINREGGTKGRISVDYVTEADSSPVAYEGTSGTVFMEDGQSSASIQVNLIPVGEIKTFETFSVVLSNPTGQARFCSTTDGGLTNAICTIDIVPTPQASPRLLMKTSTKMDLAVSTFKRGAGTLRRSLTNAVLIEGDWESTKSASVIDMLCHFIILPWNILFVLVPDSEHYKGWPTFWVSLALVGFITALIGDLAELLGCSISLPSAVTATVLVAVGTSLPDAFASRGAALHEKWADASIGNVTGSNAVNVFLGLGLPWLLGAVYWSYQGATEEWTLRYSHTDIVTKFPEGAFVVQRGNLFFSVMVFTICAAICITLLFIRRKYFGGMLGGARRPRIVSATVLFVLWVAYAISTSIYALREDAD